MRGRSSGEGRGWFCTAFSKKIFPTIYDQFFTLETRLIRDQHGVRVLCIRHSHAPCKFQHTSLAVTADTQNITLLCVLIRPLLYDSLISPEMVAHTVLCVQPLATTLNSHTD